MTIDWQATGSMLQGLGTIGGVGAVLIAAKWGLASFDNWKRQKLAERQIEQAERILTATYRARRALDQVRSPMMWAAELDAAERHLETLDGWEWVKEERKQKLKTAQGYFNRLDAVKEERRELDGCLPMARALFDDNLERVLENLGRQFHTISSYMDVYPDIGEGDREFAMQVRKAMYHSAARGEPDEITVAVREAVTEIERICLPILRI